MLPESNTPSRRLPASLRLARQALGRLASGGRWSDRLAPPVRRNLRWFWFDGVFAMAYDSIVVAYVALFLLTLGASSAQIGLMSALASLSAGFFLLLGVAAVERGWDRKWVSLSGGTVGRLTVLAMAVLPFVLRGPAAVMAAIALVVVRDSFNHFGAPAWMSLTADIVPLQWRGRYFSSRSAAMGIAAMVGTYLVGVIIDRIGKVDGFQVAFGLAFVASAVSAVCFARIADDRRSPSSSHPSDQTRAEWTGRRAFIAFCAAAAIWNVSLNIAGPFFNIYMVQHLNASTAAVGALTALVSLSGLPGLRLFGVLVDRWGPRRVQLITGLMIPWMPLVWTIVSSPWHVVPINLVAGFLWAGYNLSSLNLLLVLTPPERRARYAAMYQFVVTMGLAGGSALGGLMVSRWGFHALFVLSGAGRLVAALLFARFVRQPATEAAGRWGDSPVEA